MAGNSGQFLDTNNSPWLLSYNHKRQNSASNLNELARRFQAPDEPVEISLLAEATMWDHKQRIHPCHVGLLTKGKYKIINII